MDGGSISNLPIEPAILHGATEIIALDLPTRGEIDQEAHGFGPFWTKLLTTIGDRQIYLEMELAQAKGIPVHLVELTARPPVPIWDFSQTQILLETGYQQMKSALETGKISSFSQPSDWFDRLMKWISFPKHEFHSEVGKDQKAGKGKQT
jgi:predicted acylesterase/phospholipase RssA